MTWTRRGAAVAAAAGGALVAGRAIATRRNRQGRTALGGWANDPNRWHAVTVLVGLDEAMPDGRLPEPLVVLGDDVEMRMRSAPVGRGTEIAVRRQVPTFVRSAARCGRRNRCWRRARSYYPTPRPPRNGPH